MPAQKPKATTRDVDPSARLTELQENAVTVGQGLVGMAAAARGAATEQYDSVERYIREHPVKSLLIAANVGAMLGFMFLRR